MSSDPDFFPGDPAKYVVGRKEEKPARRHGRQKPKPKAAPLLFEERLLRDIRKRKEELKPVLDEVPQLMAALKALEDLK